MKMPEQLTKAICNKGFSGYSGILHRSNFGAAGQESGPQSLTAYSLNRCAKSASLLSTSGKRKAMRDR